MFKYFRIDGIDGKNNEMIEIIRELESQEFEIKKLPINRFYSVGIKPKKLFLIYR